MNPEEKAKILVEKFKPHADWNNEYGSSEQKANLRHAKQCALIAVEEMIKLAKVIDDCQDRLLLTNKKEWILFFEKVKEEITKL